MPCLFFPVDLAFLSEPAGCFRQGATNNMKSKARTVTLFLSFACRSLPWSRLQHRDAPVSGESREVAGVAFRSRALNLIFPMLQ